MLNLQIVLQLIELINRLNTMRIPADIRTTINHLIEPLLREREMLNHLEWRIQDILQDWDNVQQTENQNDDDLIADRENGNLRGNMTQ